MPIRRILSNVWNTVLEVEDMGFMVGNNAAERGLKLHLLRQDVKICDLAL